MIQGLLDFVKTPEGQGLLSAVAGGMASARRGAPVNSIGRGLLAGVQGYGNALDRQQQEQDSAFNRQFRDMQMGQMRAALEQQQGQQAWKQGLPAVLKQSQEPTYGAADEGPTMTPPDPQKLQNYLMDPRSPFADKVLEAQLFPKAPETITVGDTVLDKRTMKPLYKAPEKVDYNALVIPDGQGGYKLNDLVVGAKRDIAAAGKPQVSVDARNFTTQETEQSKIYGKGLGEIRTAINQAGYDAPGKLARLDRMEQLLQGIDGGAAAPAMADIASFAQSFGIKIDPKLGNKQAAEALAREMAGTLRQPGTGPMTDKDFDNFLRQVPSLSKTAEGRSQIITTMRAAIERDKRAAQFAREYARKNNGVIDDNFFDSLASFYAENPVVTPTMPPTNARGQSFSDPAKERRYQEWVKQQGAR